MANRPALYSSPCGSPRAPDRAHSSPSNAAAADYGDGSPNSAESQIRGAYESPPGAPPLSATHRLALSAHSHSPSSSNPQTPTSNMKPRPPQPPSTSNTEGSSSPLNASLRRRRSFANSPESKFSSPRAQVEPSGPSPPALAEILATSIHVAHDYGSPNTPSSRPGSGRGRVVQTLLDAVRSKDEGKLLEALEYIRLPQGGYAGLNDRHPVTGRTCLHEAVMLNSTGMVKALLAAGSDPNVGHSTQGPALLHAAAFGEAEMVELLLSRQADIRAVDVVGYTALHYACSGGHVETARILLAYGAEPRTLNTEGEEPLELARPDVHRQLLPLFNGQHALPVNTMNFGSPARPLSGGRQSSNLAPRPPPAPIAVSVSPPNTSATERGVSGSSRNSSLGRQPSGGGAALPLPTQSSVAVEGSRPRPPPPQSPPRTRSQTLPETPSPPAHHTATIGQQIKATDSPMSGSEKSPSPFSTTPMHTGDSLRSLTSDGEEKPRLPPPPTLELPRVVRRQLSKGAVLQDIIHAFKEDDEDIIRRSSHTGGPGLLDNFAARQPVHAQPAEQHHAPPPAVAVPATPAPAGVSFNLGAGAKQQVFASAIPMTPKFRFGVDIHASPPLAAASPAAAAAAAEAAASDATAAAQVAKGTPQLGAAPSGQQQQRQLADLPSFGRPDAPADRRPSATSAAARPSFSGVHSHSDDLGSSDLSGAPALVRDASPIHSPRPSMDGGRAPRSAHPVFAEGSTDRTRISQAVEALAQRAGPLGASTEALHLRAELMFNKSVDVLTGEVQWTRGELLGEGAFGKVYAGLNQQTGELMAVKVLELVSRHGNNQALRQQLNDLQQELEIYKKLNHKHIVGYIDACYEARTSSLYIFLEYVPGGSIASMLERFGKFTDELVKHYTRQLLLGLEYLHGRKIVHRDLKGGNVLVSREGFVKLADFGASKAFKDTTITDGMKSLKGSAFWMAPEVIKCTGYGRKADIWSLGCTVIEMLTGKHPWPDLDNPWTAMYHIAKVPEGPPRPKGCSELALSFLNLCLRHDPNERPTATELLQHPFVCNSEVVRRHEAAGGKDLKHSI